MRERLSGESKEDTNVGMASLPSEGVPVPVGSKKGFSSSSGRGFTPLKKDTNTDSVILSQNDPKLRLIRDPLRIAGLIMPAINCEGNCVLQ